MSKDYTQDELISMIKRDEELMQIVEFIRLSNFPAGSNKEVTSENVKARDAEREKIKNLIYLRLTANRERLYIKLKNDFNL